MKEESSQSTKSFCATEVDPPKNKIQAEFNVLSSDIYFQTLIEAMSNVAIVVNRDSQIIYANENLLKLLGISEIKDSIGKKPGELIDCDNLKGAAEGCGTTKVCGYCGLSNSIQQAMRTGKPALFESRIISRAINDGQAFDVEVKTSQIHIKEQTFFIVSIKDVSDKKRRLILEKNFFHDILNTASGLHGILLALDDKGLSDESKEIIDYAKKAGGELVDEILAHRMLLSAENSDLKMVVSRCNSLQVLHDVSAYLSYHEIASAKRIFIDPFSHNVPFDTDPVILKRILINVVKNALEACVKGDTIQMGSRIGNKSVKFWVNNSGTIPEDVQNQLFQRSFSTKGHGRGIGTYSIKLLTSYLAGEVTFNSNQEEGTTFFIDIPLSPPEVAGL